MAIRAGGKDDVSDSRVLWTSRISSYVPSPVVHDGRIWCVDDKGIVTCMKTADGEEVFRRRLEGAKSGFVSKPFYASAILIGDKLYSPSRTGGTFVVAAKNEFEQLANNAFDSDKSDFNATPAVADRHLFLRSNRFLYCVSAE